MADKKFYLKERGGEWKEISVEISPILAQTLDETIDNITISLALNTREQPYAPNKTEVEVVQVYDDDSIETINKFVVSADNVELVTQNPLRYKHSLTLVQRAQNFTKKEVRNTVFTTSLETSFFSLEIGTSAALLAEYYNLQTHAFFNSYTFSHLPAKVNLKKKKINGMVGLFNFFIQKPVKFYQTDEQTSTGLRHYDNIKCEYQEPTKWSDAFVNNNNAEFKSHIPTLTFSITLNGVTESMEWNISDEEFVNNNEYKVPQNILDWIATYDDGELSIEFGDVSINTDWNSNYIPNAKMPIALTMSVKLTTFAVENSCYYVIDTLLKQQLKETKVWNRTTDPEHYVPLFELPNENHNPELYELLSKTSAPNFVFTQGNMYECLVEIFKLFDAIFTIDNDGYLDIEYYNVHKKIEFNDNKKAGRASSIGEERYVNRLISYFQNTKINDRFPNSNQENATAFIRSKSIGIPQESDFVFMVQKPIDIITNVKLSINLSTKPAFLSDYTTQQGVRFITRAYLGNLPTQLIDITNYVNEKSIWSLLSETKTIPIDGDWSKTGKYNSFYYEKGSKYICISDFYQGYDDIRQSVLSNVVRCAISSKFGVTVLNYSNFGNLYKYNTPDFRNVKMAVEYIALVDGKIVNESIDYKYNGGVIINQNNGSIDINKLGLNMVGLSLKLGQPTLTMTQKICRWEDRVKKGEFFIKDGEKWVANTCSYTLINNDLIEATIEFVKNFNGLASRIELNREKRLSNISNELTVKCEENYGEYAYYTTIRANTINKSQNVVFKLPILFNQIAMGFGLTIPPYPAGSSEDRSSQINYVSISDVNANTYTNQELEQISGYVESNVDGVVTINENSDFSGESVVIPQMSTMANSIYWDIMNGCFDYDETATPYNGNVGDYINIYILKIDDEIIGAGLGLPSLPPNPTPISTIIADEIPSNTNKIEYASLTALDENGDVIQEDEYSADHIAIPMVVYGSGNSVCFEMSFDSPITAGSQLLDNYESVFGVPLADFVWNPLVSHWFSKYVLYTSKSGEASKFTIDFIMLQEELTRQFPKLTKSDNTPLATFSFGAIEELAYYKKPNEIFALNYQIHFLPLDGAQDCFLSNEFIKNNGFSNGLNKKRLHIKYSTSDDLVFDILDVKAFESDGWIRAEIVSSNANFSLSNNYLQLSFITALESDVYESIKSWAICDENDSIYFSSNIPPKESFPDIPESHSFSIFFIPRHHRKEE